MEQLRESAEKLDRVYMYAQSLVQSDIPAAEFQEINHQLEQMTMQSVVSLGHLLETCSVAFLDGINRRICQLDDLQDDLQLIGVELTMRKNLNTLNSRPAHEPSRRPLVSSHRATMQSQVNANLPKISTAAAGKRQKLVRSQQQKISVSVNSSSPVKLKHQQALFGSTSLDRSSLRSTGSSSGSKPLSLDIPDIPLGQLKFRANSPSPLSHSSFAGAGGSGHLSPMASPSSSQLPRQSFHVSASSASIRRNSNASELSQQASMIGGGQHYHPASIVGRSKSPSISSAAGKKNFTINLKNSRRTSQNSSTASLPLANDAHGSDTASLNPKTDQAAERTPSRRVSVRLSSDMVSFPSSGPPPTEPLPQAPVPSPPTVPLPGLPSDSITLDTNTSTDIRKESVNTGSLHSVAVSSLSDTSIPEEQEASDVADIIVIEKVSGIPSMPGSRTMDLSQALANVKLKKIQSFHSGPSSVAVAIGSEKQIVTSTSNSGLKKAAAKPAVASKLAQKVEENNSGSESSMFEDFKGSLNSVEPQSIDLSKNNVTKSVSLKQLEPESQRFRSNDRISGGKEQSQALLTSPAEKLIQQAESTGELTKNSSVFNSKDIIKSQSIRSFDSKASLSSDTSQKILQTVEIQPQKAIPQAPSMNLSIARAVSMKSLKLKSESKASLNAEQLDGQPAKEASIKNIKEEVLKLNDLPANAQLKNSAKSIIVQQVILPEVVPSETLSEAVSIKSFKKDRIQPHQASQRNFTDDSEKGSQESLMSDEDPVNRIVLNRDDVHNPFRKKGSALQTFVPPAVSMDTLNMLKRETEKSMYDLQDKSSDSKQVPTNITTSRAAKFKKETEKSMYDLEYVDSVKSFESASPLASPTKIIEIQREDQFGRRIDIVSPPIPSASKSLTHLKKEFEASMDYLSKDTDISTAVAPAETLEVELPEKKDVSGLRSSITSSLSSLKISLSRSPKKDERAGSETNFIASPSSTGMGAALSMKTLIRAMGFGKDVKPGEAGPIATSTSPSLPNPIAKADRNEVELPAPIAASTIRNSITGNYKQSSFSDTADSANGEEKLEDLLLNILNLSADAVTIPPPLSSGSGIPPPAFKPIDTADMDEQSFMDKNDDEKDLVSMIYGYMDDIPPAITEESTAAAPKKVPSTPSESAPKIVFPDTMQVKNESMFSKAGLPAVSVASPTSAKIKPDISYYMDVVESPRSEDGSKNFVRALYDYKATAEDELSINTGEVLKVIGPDIGDGWMECESPAGQSGLVPSSYVVSFSFK